ncbi:MAG TPA: hypothetical protein PKN33_19425 [Phycisphaerae bacterium]|nr:hypothetical protein [Phycisphaerae bacterium]
MRVRAKFLAVVIVLGLSIQASATYTVDILGESNGSGMTSSIEVAPGDRFSGFVNLSAATATQSDSAIIRLVFDNPGLIYNSNWFAWSSPYTTGGIDDFSVPDSTGSGVIDVNTFTDGLAPTDIDIRFENLTDNFGDFFETGTLISFELTVPASTLPGSSYTISPVPDTFTDGASFVDAVAGDSLTVNVIPEPATSVMACVLSIAVLARRKR